MGKIRLLVLGWFHVPHSYSMVNCFQLVSLYKQYGDQLEVYIKEQPYYNKEWENARKLVYDPDDNDIINSFKQWNGEEIDLVYSITYPYDITEFKMNGKIVPKCVFYTAEFSWLDEGYFTIQQRRKTLQEVKDYLKKDSIWFTAPSIWSANGLKQVSNTTKNRVITHGVDDEVFCPQFALRNRIRKTYNVKDTDILFINIGAMTQNKGIMEIIVVMNELVNRRGQKHFKLLLKGMGDLYTSKGFLQQYIAHLEASGIMKKEESDILFKDHIIFIDKTLSYDRINSLYNAADLYLSPYLAEGFNLTVLESLCSHLPVLVPKTGTTQEYISDLLVNGSGSDFILQVESQVVKTESGMMQNAIKVKDIINVIIEKEQHLQQMKTRRGSGLLHEYITEHYSWKVVSKLLMEYFRDILETTVN